jgi:cell division septal protein FtsQ
LDSITIGGSNAHYLIIWVFFTLFVGIALAIDFGIIDKILHIFRIRNRSGNSNNTYQKREISSVLSAKPNSPQQEQRHVIKRAFVWTIIWISLAVVFAVIIYLTIGYENITLFLH